MSDIKAGDWVKVTVTEKVEDVASDGAVLLNDWDYYFSESDDRVKIEKVDPPAPPLPTTPGSVIRFGPSGTLLLRTTSGRWLPESGGAWLVREAKFYEVIFDAGTAS